MSSASGMEPGISAWFRGGHDDRASLEAANQAGFQYLRFKCLDDRWHSQGEAILHVQKKFLVDAKGGFIQGKYLGASDGYYKHYVENEGEPHCLPEGAFHHLCLCEAKHCSARVREGFVIHIGEWQWVPAASVKRLLREWGYRQMPMLEVEASASRVRPSALRASVPRPDHNPNGSEESGSLGEADEDDVGSDAEVVPAQPAQTRRKRRIPKRSSKRKTAERATCALDEVLEPGGEEPGLPSGSAGGLLSEGLRKLRRQLGDKEGSRDKKRSLEPAAALAAKATTSAAAMKSSSKKPKSGLASALRKALRKEADASDGEDEFGDDDDDEEGEDSNGVFSGLNCKRQKLRLLAKQQPGKLLVAGVQNFSEQLGRAFGEESEDPLRPMAVRYLLSVVAPSYPGNTLNDADYRELRSLAEMLDQLVRGETATLGDFLIQRFKAKLMATRDASWGAAKYLELIPIDPIHHGTTGEEEEWVRKLRIREAKLDESLRKSR